jgi:hypothetical protein
MLIAESAFCVMLKVVEVTIENISVRKWNQSWIHRAAAGDRGFIGELAFRMYR